MQQRPSQFTRATVRLVGAALIAVVAIHPVLAEEDDDDLSFEQKIIRGIMSGLGAQTGPGAGINYRERSPLVVPPTRDLPPPRDAAALTNPAWPRDPDQQAKTKKKTARAPTVRDVELMNDPGAALRPDELNQRRPGGGAVTTPQRNDDEGGGRALPPSLLGYTGGLFGSLFSTRRKEETATFTQEPPRTSLVAPPPGYQTPSPNQPYGLGLQKWTPTVAPQADRGTKPD